MKVQLRNDSSTVEFAAELLEIVDSRLGTNNEGKVSFAQNFCRSFQNLRIELVIIY